MFVLWALDNRKMLRPWTFIILMSLCQNLCQASCVSRGRFPNDVRGDCSGYTTCLMGFNGFVQYNLTCPPSFIYNHIENQCTNATGYQCLPTHNCTQPGNFKNPSSENCNSYIACVESINDLITARLIECPKNKVFDLIERKCVNMTEFDCYSALESPRGFENTHKEIDTIHNQCNKSSNTNLPCNVIFLMLTIFIVILYNYS